MVFLAAMVAGWVESGPPATGSLRKMVLLRVASVPLMTLAILAIAGPLSPIAHAVSIWDGGGSNDNWTTGANWFAIFGPGVAPPNDGTADIVMPASGGLVQTPIVDVPYSIDSLTFNDGNGRFVILGAAELTIGAGGVTNNDADIQSVIGSVKLAANQTWNAVAGPLQMDAVNLNGFDLTLAGTHPVNLPSVIVGAGDLTVANTYTSTVTMSGGSSNTYSGLTSVNAGTLNLQKSGGATAVPESMHIFGGGAVVLYGNEQIAHANGHGVFIGNGSLNLNGYTETLDSLNMTGGNVSTGAGMLRIGQFLHVSGFSTTATGNIELGDVTASVENLGSITTPSSLTIGESANGTLDIISGGDLNSGSSYIGLQLGSTGAVTVNGGGSTWTNSGFLGIGEFGTGELEITAGGKVSNTHATVGQAGSATVLVAGPGSRWTNTSFLEIGNHAEGALTIENGGMVTNTDGYIGRGSGTDGTVVVRGTNSTWTNSNRLVVGESGTGALNVEAGGKVTVTGDASVNSLSQINVSGGTFDVGQIFTMNGGSLTADAGAIVEVGYAVLKTGATLEVQNQSEFTDLGGTYVESGVVMRVNSGATYNTSFMAISNTPGPAAELIVDGADTRMTSTSCCIDVGFGGTGVMTVTGGARIETGTGAVGSFEYGPAPSIGTLTLDGRDANGNPSAWIINVMNMGLFATSQGTINIRNGALFQATGGLNVGTPGSGHVFVEGLDGSGNPSLLDAGNLNIGGGGYGNGTGEVTASAGGRIEAGNISIGGAGGVGDLTVTGAGSALVQTGVATITVGHTASGGATLNVQNNGSLTSGTGAIDVNATGEINLNSSGVLDAHGPINMNGGAFNFLGGTLHAGAFNGNLLNEGGTLAPGHSAGATTISGNYTQRDDATLEIEIGGVLPGQWDTLAVAGNAVLDGAIEVKLIDGFEPVLGNSFTILTTDVGNVGGVFGTEMLPVVNGVTFDVVYNPKSIVLTAAPALPAFTADFDEDGDVDGDDLAQWQGDFGANGLSDADDDGDSDGDDFLEWQRQLGNGLPATAAAAVPEPAGIAWIAALPLLGGFARLGRTRRIR